MTENVRRLQPRPASSWDIPLLPTCVSSWWEQEPEELEWLVPGVLLKNEVTLFAGMTKLGKTMLCQQLMTAAAIGGEWIGQEVQRFRSFGFFAEDREQILKIRQAKINAHYGIDYPDLEQEMWLTSRDKLQSNTVLVQFNARFGGAVTLTPRWNQLYGILKDEGIRVLFIDTSARTFGGNENDRGQVTAYIEQLTMLAEEIDGSVVLNAHPSKPGPKAGAWYSGSTAWESSVRLTVSLERPESYSRETGEDEDARVFHVMGSNYGGRNAPRRIRWENGVFVAEQAQTRAPMDQFERQALDYRMLEGVRTAIVNGARVPADELGAGSAPKRARRVPELKLVPYGELVASVQRLLSREQLLRVVIDNRVFIRPPDMTYPGEAS